MVILHLTPFPEIFITIPSHIYSTLLLHYLFIMFRVVCDELINPVNHNKQVILLIFIITQFILVIFAK